MSLFKKIFHEYEAYKDWRTTRSVFLNWAQRTLRENEIIAIADTPIAEESSLYSYVRRKNKWIITSKAKLEPPNKIVLVLCKAKEFSKKENWIQIFRSPLYEIWELSSRHTKDMLPIRFGLDSKEKKFLLELARKSITHFLLTGNGTPSSPLTIPPRLKQRASLDVALWVDGSVRGSIIKINMPLFKCVQAAAIGATRDIRFKPVSALDLDNLRIEITIFSDLFIPLGSMEIKKNDIYTEKGYFLGRDNKSAWYLPQVFNAVKFATLKDYLESLSKKAGLAPRISAGTKIKVFEVIDFIESLDREHVLDMHGPLINIKNDFNNVAKDAADWLCGLQDQEGFIPTIINKVTGPSTSLDWPRMLFVAWALAEFAKATGEVKYHDAATKLVSYGEKLLPQTMINGEQRILALAYMGKTAIALDKIMEANFITKEILRLLTNTSNLSTISNLQVASLFLNLFGVSGDSRSSMGEQIFNQTLSLFLERVEKGYSVSLAEYAELVTITYKIDSLSYRKIVSWYTGLQREDGAFPDTQFSNFIYTRGTSKIFEVLALDPENKPNLIRAAKWLSEMQFSKETFSIPTNTRSLMVGGFRHDLLNFDAWIDSAGHTILAAARLKKNGLAI